MHGYWAAPNMQYMRQLNGADLAPIFSSIANTTLVRAGSGADWRSQSRERPTRDLVADSCPGFKFRANHGEGRAIRPRVRSRARYGAPPARGRRRSIVGIRRSAAISTCASPPTAPGFISRRRSAGRRWSSCSPRCSSARATSISWSRPLRSAASRSRMRRSSRSSLTLRSRPPAGCSTSAPTSTTGCNAGRSTRCASSREAGTGGLKPYLHVRRGLWAKVTRALFFDLVALGEEREVEGRAMFGVVSMGTFFAMAPADQVRDFA